MSGAFTKLLSAWVRESKYKYVHRTGACIERRGYPDTPGWYLTSTAAGERRFEPTPQGCDDAFVAFSADDPR